MPIHITTPPEPLSAKSYLPDQHCLIVESEASRLLAREMERYCDGEINGRSFLIAGHRGAGKTTIVSYAFLQAWKNERRKGMRPILVHLHGPSLLPPPEALAPAATVETADGKTRPPSETELALMQMVLGLHRAVTQEVSGAYRLRFRQAKDPRDALGRAAGALPLTTELMKQFARGSGEPAGTPPPRRAGESHLQILREAAAQLEAELYECPTAARLREFWNLGGFLQSGILFPSPPRDDQGFRELLAVAGVCEAYCRISGTLTLTQTRNTSDAQENTRTTTTEAKGQDLFRPALALLTGGLAGSAALTNPGAALGATAVGLAAAAAAGLVLKSTTTQTRKRTLDREYSFLADLSLSTLDRALPMLIERLLAAGLAPIFVVDELDKVQHLPERIFGIVRHMKKLVSENAFFCFLTDRNYYESVVRTNATQAFPVESTYYTHRLFVVFRHRDMHRFLQSLLTRPEVPEADVPAPTGKGGSSAEIMEEAPESAATDRAKEDQNDWRVLPLLLLHRGQLHTVDMWRQLANWRAADGTVSLGPGDIRTRLMYRLEVAVQIAIEVTLESTAIRERLEREPEFRRLVHDALLYPTRQWLQAPEAPLELDEGAGVERFGEYLEARTGVIDLDEDESWGERADVPVVSVEDRAFLLEAVRQMAGLLASREALAAAFDERWTGYGDEPDENRLTKATIAEALPPRSEPPLLERVGEGHFFRWAYTPAGQLRNPPAPPPIQQEPEGPAEASWVQDLELIETIDAFLASL